MMARWLAGCWVAGLVATAGLVGCGHSGEGALTAAPAVAPVSVSQPAETGGDAVDGGQLAAGAQYKALLAAAPGRADAAASECLLAMGAGGAVSLRAEFAPATSTWPESEPAPTLLGAAAPRVLTPYGQVGAAVEGPLLVAFTRLPVSTVRRDGLVLDVLPDGAVEVAFTDGRTPAARVADTAAAALAAVRAVQGEPLTVFVLASAATPVAQVYALLRALPHGLPVALTLMLPAGSHVPTPPAVGAGSTTGSSVCPQGLPALEDSAPQGELGRAALLSALGPLRDAGARCLAAAPGPAAAGGRVKLGLRIGAAGQVLHACLVQDAIGDPTLAACLAESARGLRFPTPTPVGTVDVHLPLNLQPIELPAPAGTCD